MKKSKDSRLEEENVAQQLDKIISLKADEEIIKVEELNNDVDESRLSKEFIGTLFVDEAQTEENSIEDLVSSALGNSETQDEQRFKGSGHTQALNKTRAEEMAEYQQLEDDWVEEFEKPGKNKKRLIYFSCILLIVIMLAAGWSVWKLIYPTQKSDDDAIVVRKKELREKQQLKQTMMLEIARIEDLLSQFSKDSSAEDKLKFFYNAENYKEEILAYFQQEQNKTLYTHLTPERVLKEWIKGREVWTAVCSYKGASSTNHTIFFFHQEPNDDYKIDWESIAGTQKDDVQLFINNQSTEPIEVRAIVTTMKKIEYFNWGFNDNEYEVLRLAIGDDIILWGYFKKDNLELVAEINRTLELAEAFRNLYGYFKARTMLKVKFPENNDVLNKECVEIVEVVSPFWLDPRDMETERNEHE